MDTNKEFEGYFTALKNSGSEEDTSNRTPLFDFLQPKRKPNSSSNANQTATLTVKADTDVLLYCDGEYVDKFETNKVKRTTIPIGQHILTIESVQFSDITEDREIDVSDSNKSYTLLITNMKVREKTKYDELIEKTAQESDDFFANLFNDQSNDKVSEDNPFERYRILAEQGNMDAQYELGNCYNYGNDVPCNKKLAFDWYLEAAKQGHVEAQCTVAYMYRDGDEGIPQSYDLAAEWFRDAAEQGHEGAQIELGTCYAMGWGVPRDYYKAIEWYKKAVKQGRNDAIYKIKILEKYIH